MVPYALALLAKFDDEGQWAAIGPGFIMIGAATGPGVAGFVRTTTSFEALGGWMALIIAAAAFAYALSSFSLPQMRTFKSREKGK